MEERIVSSVDIDTNIYNVSLALNGLLNLEENIKVARYEYHLDVKRDQLYARSPEKRTLRQFYGNFKTLNFRLEKLDDFHTRLYYDCGYSRFASGEKVILIMGIIEVVLLLLVMFVFRESMDETGMFGFFFGIILAVVLLMGGLLALMVFYTKSVRKMDATFHRFFLYRLDEYCKIADEHQREQNYYNNQNNMNYNNPNTPNNYPNNNPNDPNNYNNNNQF